MLTQQNELNWQQRNKKTSYFSIKIVFSVALLRNDDLKLSIIYTE